MKVEQVLIADDPSTFVTRQAESVRIELGGIPGDRHYGLLRPADVRQKMYKRGTLIANRRQISIVSIEDCKQIADQLGVPEVKPEWLGANMLVSGIEAFTLLPAGRRLLFAQGAGLICEGVNEPCIGPGNVIAAAYERPELARRFVKAAYNLRGIVCSVEREGLVFAGEAFEVKSITG